VLIEWEFGSSNVGIVCDAVQCASVAGVACCVFCCVKKIPKTNQNCSSAPHTNFKNRYTPMGLGNCGNFSKFVLKSLNRSKGLLGIRNDSAAQECNYCQSCLMFRNRAVVKACRIHAIRKI